MLFTEARFFVFFAVAFGVYWALRRDGWRKTWLLLGSYVFYGAWDPRFLTLIVASTLLDFAVGRALGTTSDRGRRRAWLAASLVGNLGLLGVFKYHDFFVTSGAELLGWLGLSVEPRLLGLVLPVGISFYTFQTLSYTLDVYRGQMEPHRSLLDFALFVAFFPQLVAGPIVRAVDFLPQLGEPRRAADVAWRAHLNLFLIGFVKKACVSDNVAPIVDQVFAAPETFGAGARWLGAALYTLQIYCDFSGYSDMAIAAAGLLGYRLTLNFDFPYLARSITEFWRRWHISLSTWFRDYLYIPLGGNRGSTLTTYRNLVLVFLLCGLWHGASFSFVAWGLYHGAFLVLERVGLRWPRRLALPGTLLIVLVGWVLFRAPTLGAAATYLAGMATAFGDPALAGIEHAGLWWAGLGAFALVHLAMVRRAFTRPVAALPQPLYALAYGAAVALALPFVATEYQPFIYFQF